LLNLGILISGRGSNMEAILKSIKKKKAKDSKEAEQNMTRKLSLF
jgi:folate-dependent phosphoribosylglycinamide formyltransferase PurN